MEAGGVVLTSDSVSTGAHTMHFGAQMSVWFRGAGGLRVSRASGALAQLQWTSGSLLGRYPVSKPLIHLGNLHLRRQSPPPTEN